MVKVRIGCDPEIFLRNPNSGEFVSAYGFLPGTKQQPHKFKAHAIQVDGVAAEININPAISEEMFVRSIETIETYLRNRCGSSYELVHLPVAQFSKEYFDSLPEEAKLLGCDPDFDAWTGDANVPPPMEMPMRTGAGHIHIGWRHPDPEMMTNKDHWNDCVAMAKQMDYYVGIFTLLYDKDARRRLMYGRAGCFRPKPYGVEYRVPSNAWLAHDELKRWIYRASVAAYEDLLKGTSPIKRFQNLAQEIINENMADWREWGDDELFPESVKGIPNFDKLIVEDKKRA